MGYESRIYIVRKTAIKNESNMLWGEVLAVFDLSKCYPLSDVLRNKPKTNCFIYADDGNTEIIYDRYGRPLTEAMVDDTIQVLKKIVAKGDFYWRYRPLLGALEPLAEANYDDIVVLHYGY